jgi:hypothetical protein
MRRSRIIALVVTIASAMLAGVEGPIQAKVPGTNGRILFARREIDLDNRFRQFIYTANPDGSDQQRLTPQQTRFATELARWSPDGSEIALTTDFCEEGIVCVAYLVDPNTRSVRTLPNPDPSLPMLCGVAWSVDDLLACVSVHFDSVQSSDGIYTIRSSDGGGLTRITNFLSNTSDGAWPITELLDELLDR